MTTTPSPTAQPTQDHTSQQPGPNTNNSSPHTKDDSDSEPTPASSTRDNTPPGGVNDPSRAEQDALDNAVPRDENGDPTRPPNPNDGNWIERINGDGSNTPGRNNNCVDTTLSTVDTYAGTPTAAGARTPDPDNDGTPSDRGERGGRDRIENTLGARFNDLGNGRDAYNRLENTLRNNGHGSQAVIITQDANGRAHAWNAVNHNGKITYIDAQTGQRSPHPLHNGNNGVFAIPLDPDRRPVAAGGDNRSGNSDQQGHASDGPTGRADRRPESAPTDTHRRAPAEPAGQSPDAQKDADDKPQHPRDDPQRTNHPRLTEPETVDSTHYGMEPMRDQQNVRQTNDVRQMDMDPVHQQLNDWLTPIPREDGSGETRVPLVDALKACSPPRPDDPDHKPVVLRHDDLKNLLPGFEDMHPGERGAVVASLARLSLKFHESHAVGASPEPQDGYPSRGPAKHASAGWAANRRDAEINQGLEDELGGIGKSLKDAGEHRPDFTGRNYATVEVYDPVSKQISYVVDSSYPGEDNKHSEKNILDYLDSLNAECDKDKQYEPISMFTDREPCGRGSGYRNCAALISQRMSNVDVFYGTGYRKDADVVDAGQAPQGGHKGRFEQDLIKNNYALGKIWIRAMKDGGLANTGPE
ncbi:toxin glutamine deamidase domain-containing protein [Streptomyces sp. B-S-A8]|uniref:Toxin glutamine deamidase domain-containing protein n=1 Tax=Streptomyces solicavernae TaxID=3043614 RepID=A0ABT6S1P2_9ACTN|nr:toxin glutamine deamidase domain-containing protein [Streptomyces sp. B-S-A8]MDI3390510.1 toxin glutamine deamidase domain-containing protein [Streptomyces sp. B-S-A8]